MEKRKEDINIEELTNEELYDLFTSVDNHIKYLKDSILEEEKEEDNDVKI